MNNATSLDFRSTNALWASVLVETLARSGVKHAVLSPGSRSTPLTMAFARHAGIESMPVLDERSAAFFALGLAKQTGVPAVLVCTSGTAAANYFPAVIEAHESGVPLLVITADRPPELRACASGQTIDQQKLYGTFPRFFHELAVPELDAGRLRYLRQTIRHAFDRTLSPDAGPVHLNAPFRDPLPPLDDGGAAARFAASVRWDEFFTHLAPVDGEVGAPASARGIANAVNARFSPESHGLLVVGPNQPVAAEAFAGEIGALAKRLGWPVLADGLAPLRNFASVVPNLVTTYDTILRNHTAAGRLTPDVVICIGAWPTSKVLRGWIEATDVPIWMCTSRSDNRDALHGRARPLHVSPGALAAILPEPAESAGGYARMWGRYEAQVRQGVDDRLGALAELAEPKAAWLLARTLPANTPLVIANSMPIRDVEYFWPPGDRGIRPWCNRGANGIDGTLSTAIGIAAAAGHPAVLLTGDLALLHDTNGFLLLRRLRAALTIVLINNRGGGIFEHLPVARFDPPFEEYFATPQNVAFDRLAAAYGVEHVVITGWPELAARLEAPPSARIRILEIRTDRKRDAALRRQWLAELASSLG